MIILKNPMLFFYLAILFWLVAWAGTTVFSSATWNKACAIACLIAGLIAIVLLIFFPGA